MRSIWSPTFVGHINFKNLWNLENLLKCFTVASTDSVTSNKVFLTIFIGENHFKRGKYRTEPAKCWWNIVLWHDLTQKHMCRCFYTMPAHTKNLRKKNMGQSLFKKYSKIQKFDEILYCGMTRFRNVKLGSVNN